jgi:hypothetical protein
MCNVLILFFFDILCKLAILYSYKLVRIQAKDADTIKSVSDFELVDSSVSVDILIEGLG